LVKSLSEPHPFCGVASAPVDDQWYVDGSGQPPLAPVVDGIVVGPGVGIEVGVERDVELPAPAAAGEADDPDDPDDADDAAADEERVPLGVRLVATLLPAAAGWP
jgi:hypothetical protein